MKATPIGLLALVLLASSCALGGPEAAEMDLVVSEIDASPLQPRIGHSSVPAADSLLIWGGDSGDEHRPHQDGAVLSLTGGGWDAIPPAPVPPRTQHVAVWTGTEMIVWGGATSEPGPDRHAWDGAAYHPQDDTWRPIAPAPEGRSHAMGVATDEWMVIGGGHTPNRPTDSLLSYAIADDRWHATDIDIQVQAMAATGPGPVLLAGTDTDRALAVRRYEPEGESVSVVPHDVELTGSLRYLGIASNDRGSAYLLASDDTRTHVARLSGEGTLETIASHDVRDLRPPVDLVVAPYDRGAMWVTSAEEVISLNGRNLSVFDPHSGGLGYRRLTELADYCGAEAAEALSAQGLIAWGGRNCHNGDTSLTNRGLRIQLPS